MTTSEIYDFLKQYIDKKTSEANIALENLFIKYKTKEVGENINSVNTVSTSIDNVNNVSTNIVGVNTTATNIDNVNIVSEDINNINTVSSNIVNVDTTATNIANVNNVGSNINKVNIVSDNISYIDTVNVHITNVDTVANNVSSVIDYNNKYNLYHNDVELVQAYLNVDLGTASVKDNGHLLISQINKSSTPYVDETDGRLKINYN